MIILRAALWVLVIILVIAYATPLLILVAALWLLTRKRHR